jgi:hypothetical protein
MNASPFVEENFVLMVLSSQASSTEGRWKRNLQHEDMKTSLILDISLFTFVSCIALFRGSSFPKQHSQLKYLP